jgi:hypothetical protein
MDHDSWERVPHHLSVDQLARIAATDRRFAAWPVEREAELARRCHPGTWVGVATPGARWVARVVRHEPGHLVATVRGAVGETMQQLAGTHGSTTALTMRRFRLLWVDVDPDDPEVSAANLDLPVVSRTGWMRVMHVPSRSPFAGMRFAN